MHYNCAKIWDKIRNLYLIGVIIYDSNNATNGKDFEEFTVVFPAWLLDVGDTFEKFVHKESFTCYSTRLYNAN